MMWNFPRKPFLALLLVLAVSQFLALWNYIDKRKVTANDNAGKEPNVILKRLILESSGDSSNDKEQDGSNTETTGHSETEVAGDKGTSLELPPHTYIKNTRIERKEIGIDINLLLALPRVTLKYTPPRFLPGYKNPCFPVNYSEVLAYAREKSEHRKQFADIDADSEQTNKTAILCLPSFYLVGWPKCGTTELTRYIQRHQSVYTGIYEVHYWNREFEPLRYDRRYFYQLSLLQYATQMRLKTLNNTQVDDYTGILSYGSVNFPELDKNGTNIYGKYSLLGDYTPTYAYGFETQVPHKIQHVIPNAKIIISLRDPIERTLSHINYIFKFKTGQKFDGNYNHNASAMSQYIHELFIENIKAYNDCLGVYCENYCATTMPDRGDMFADTPKTTVHKCLIISLYHISIAKYMQLFPSENILIVDLGEFSKNRIGVLEETLFPFLGLEPYTTARKNQVNATWQTYANTNTNPLVEFLPETRDLLREFYREPQHKLRKLLNGRHFSWFDEYDIQ